MSIAKQYDAGNTARKYAESSLANAKGDAGRNFLYGTLSNISRTSSLLDVGCGNGVDLATYKAMGFKDLCGIDPSTKFVEQARELAGDGVEVLEGSFEHIPYGDARFDIVVSRFALHYCKDVGKALQEAARVLKPGGRLAVIASHPLVDALEQADGDGNITITLFGGTVPITFPKHALVEYFCETFLRDFALELVYEYCGKERDRGANGLPNALCFVAKKKG